MQVYLNGTEAHFAYSSIAICADKSLNVAFRNQDVNDSIILVN